MRQSVNILPLVPKAHWWPSRVPISVVFALDLESEKVPKGEGH